MIYQKRISQVHAGAFDLWIVCAVFSSKKVRVVDVMADCMTEIISQCAS